MGKLIAGARQLPTQHISIRVPWHDAGWDGTICKSPLGNTSCLVLVNIGENRKDAREIECAGKRIDRLEQKDWPPCVEERATFLAPFEFTRTIEHKYKNSKTTHGHLRPTKYRQPPFSAPAIPFNWLRRENIEGEDGYAERLQLGYEVEREPTLEWNKAKNEDEEDKPGEWVNERTNQLCLLDTFFSGVQPKKSLCFFYAKRTPLAPDDRRRVIVAVGYVTALGDSVEYENSDETAMRAVTFERNVLHSIRPGFEDGFVMPYHAVLEAAERDPTIDPAACVAFVPDDDRGQFSYVAEHVGHDAAIAGLLSCAGALHRTKGIVGGPWDQVIKWIDVQLNKLWKMRGPCPGLGSALCALGVPYGTLVAQDLAAAQAAANEWNDDPWKLFEAALEDPSLLSKGLGDKIGPDVKKLYKKLPALRRALLKLLSRFALTESQATRFYQETEREASRIEVTDADLLANPYLLYEIDRIAGADAIGLSTIDRGLFPEQVVRDKHPLPTPSALEGPLDGRRVRAFVIDALERAAEQGHTLQLRNQIIHSVRSLDVKPEMPLSTDVLGASEQPLDPLVKTLELPDGTPAFQLDRFVSTRELIRNEVNKRRAGKRHASKHKWRKLVNEQFATEKPPEDPELEEKARQEKAAALEELFSARMTVLVGPAGTGKTTLLKTLCALPEVDAGKVLLLAPTGKARVRLGPGALTVAQFLLRFKRYDGNTGRYFIDPSNPEKNKVHKTVVIDECSMMTEEQLAAVLDALSGVERLILVGDPRQLPPIGSGRPFVDVVSFLSPANLESLFPRVVPSYAELTVSRRQKGKEARDDLVLAQWFSGRPVEPGADEIWDQLGQKPSKTLRLVQWDSPATLPRRLLSVLAEELKFASPDDENTFEMSLGATLFEGKTYFRVAKDDQQGASDRAESWQILSPVRAGLHGVEAVNRLLQDTFRKRAKEWSTVEKLYKRKTSAPMGPQGLLYGDKVISVVNRVRKYCWPKPDENPYVANGDIGIVVGDYKPFGKKFFPKNLVVEFVAHRKIGVKYFKSEFGDEGTPPLELAYALTVHKTQGSEFGITFVVLPNPCRLLSRELLYTALTRQKDKLIIFHQGNIRDLLRFSDASESEIARRCTNLFENPRLIEIDNRFLEERLIHRTTRGDRVRSKSEVILADKLHQFGIAYEYERPFIGADGSHRLPDFTIDDPASGQKVIWEHLGMLVVPAYKRSWERKLAWYAANGVLPAGGPNGTLVTSEDSLGGGIDSKALDAQIRRVFTL